MRIHPNSKHLWGWLKCEWNSKNQNHVNWNEIENSANATDPFLKYCIGYMFILKLMPVACLKASTGHVYHIMIIIQFLHNRIQVFNSLGSSMGFSFELHVTGQRNKN